MVADVPTRDTWYAMCQFRRNSLSFSVALPLLRVESTCSKLLLR
jgi:hypothetical protein